MSGVTTSSLSLAGSLRNWVILDYEEANGLTIRPWAPFLLSFKRCSALVLCLGLPLQEMAERPLQRLVHKRLSAVLMDSLERKWRKFWCQETFFSLFLMVLTSLPSLRNLLLMANNYERDQGRPSTDERDSFRRIIFMSENEHRIVLIRFLGGFVSCKWNLSVWGHIRKRFHEEYYSQRSFILTITGFHLPDAVMEGVLLSKEM